MQRFKKGDPVLILPKFAHLYPAETAIVTKVTPDSFRSMFNGYTVVFPDGSTASVFEFQIIDNPADFRTLIGFLAFDSQRHLPAAKMRGPTADRRVLLQTPPFDVDMKIQIGKSRASIIGQVLERSTSNLLKPVEVSLLKNGAPTLKTKSDSMGVFRFSDVPRGTANILVVIPQDLSRILGEIAI